MNITRRLAREFLNEASLTDFWLIVDEAKISDEDKIILDDKFVHGKSYIQISEERRISPETVKKIVKNAYEKVARVI